MSDADTAGYQLDVLAEVLNKLRKQAIKDERASVYLYALDDVAEEMGLMIEKVYKR